MIDGDRIEALMKQRGIKQTELARRVGVAQPTIFKLIHSNKTGSKYLHAVARELRTTAAYLTRETDDPESDLPDEEFTAEERELIDLWRRMEEEDRKLLLAQARRSATRPPPPTLHEGGQDFRGAGKDNMGKGA